MAENVGSVYYTVEADVSPLVNAEQQATQSTQKMAAGLGRVDKAANESNFALKKTSQAVQNIGRDSEVAGRSVGALSKLLGGLLTLQGATSLLQMAEAYGEMAERVQMATSSTEEFELVQTRLLSTANKTYRSLSEAQEVFIRTSAALKSMGYETNSALDVTDSLSFAFVKNATSVARAQSATDAFSKALNKGRVEGDAWESLLAAVPTIVDDIAAASGKSAEEIRRLGVEGQISARMLTEGLRKSLDDNRKAADGMATTVKDAFMALRNNLSAMVGEANKSTGATQLLSKAVLGLAENLGTVVNVLLVAGAGALAKYVATLGISALTSAKAALSARALAAEQLRLAIAEERAAAIAVAQVSTTSQLASVQTAAAAAAGRLTAAQTTLAAAQRATVAASTSFLTLLGGPAGIIALVASVAAGVLLFGDNSKRAAPNVDELARAVDNLTQAQLDLRKIQVGEAIQQLEKEARESTRLVSSMTKDYIELKKAKDAGRNIDGLDNANKSLIEEKAALDKVNGELQKLYELQDKLSTQKPREPVTSAGPSKPASDPEVAKRLQSMRDEAKLAALSGEARARLQAIQKLGANATAEEVAEAQRLASEIFKLETAQKAGTDSTKKSTEASKENQKVIDSLGRSLYEAGLAGEELEVIKAKAGLNEFATPDQVAQVEGLARAIYAVTQAEQNRKLLAQVDPMAAAQMGFEEQIANYQKLNDAKLISDQQYMTLKEQAETSYEERKSALQEEAFRKQSTWNNLLMSGIEQFGATASDMLIGFVSGTAKGTDAVQALAASLLREGVNSVVQMGVQYVKSLVMGKAASAAATAFGVAQAATLATAWAPAAALASLASFGANAAPAMAGITSTMGLTSGLSLAAGGGRQYGGPVDASKMYRVNENGKPEVFSGANGQQWMIPNQRGEVVSNRDATRSGGGASGIAGVTVNLIEDRERAGQVTQSVDESGYLTIEAAVADIRGGGELSQAMEQTYGVRRQGQ